MKVQLGRWPGRLDGSAADAPPDEATGRKGALSDTAARVIGHEPWLAPLCALMLLLAPNPLLWPAAVIGVSPWLARIVTIGRPWRTTPFDLPLLLLAIGAGFGSYASLNRDGATVQLAGVLAAFLLFVAAREHARSERALRLLVPGLLAGAVVGCLMLLVLVGPFLLLERLPPIAAAVAVIDRWQLGAWFVEQDWLLQRYRFRASGVGALADVGLALAFATAIGLRGQLGRALVGLTVVLFGIVLVVADNRGSMLAGALTLAMMATVWRRRLLPLIPVGAVLSMLVLVFGPIDRGLSLKTLAQRFWFWENSLFLAREVPLTGAGLGLESVQLVYRGYFQPAYPPFSHAHNIYLQGLLEYGVFGLLGLIGLGVATLWIGWRAPAASNRWVAAGRLAGFGVAMAMLTSGLTEIVLLSTLGCAISLGSLGLLAGTAWNRPGEPPPQPLPRARWRGLGSPSPSQGGGMSATRGSGAAEGPRRSWMPIVAPRSGGGGGSLFRPVLRPIVAIALLATLIAGIVVSGLGTRIAARLLLNAGTADLNHGALSESIEKREREVVLERAVRTLRTAATFDESDAAIQRNLALALAATDDTRRGRAAADRAKALTASTDRADLFQLGRAYVAISSWGEAVRAWQAAEAAPQLLQLGNRLIRARNFDQATSAFVAAARIEPDSAGAYEGITRAAQEREFGLDETIEALDPLLVSGSPTEFYARVQASRVYRDAGQLARATTELDRAEEIGPAVELSLDIGRLLMAAGRPELAELVLVWPVEHEPYDSDGWLWLARSQAEQAKHADAVSTIQRGLARLDPSGEFAPPAERLPETAAVRATEIKRDERAPLLGVMGESLIRLGRIDEAIRALDEAIAAAPRDRWLATTRDEALAVRDGARPSLLLNGAFDRTGSWSLRTGSWGAPPTRDTLFDDAPPIADGESRIRSTPPEGRSLVQVVYGVQPNRQYRLSVRLRAEGLTRGSALVLLVGNDAVSDGARVVGSDEAARTTMVTVDAENGGGTGNHLVAVVTLTPDANAGAQLIIEDAILIETGPIR